MRLLAAFSALALSAAGAGAQEAGRAGAGVIVGDPTGVTLKVFPRSTLAVDAGIGFSGDAAFYADALWYAWDLLPKPGEGTLGAYLGAGPRIETKRDATFGIRAVGGVSYWLPRHPVELFLEAGPVFVLAPDTGTDVDAGVGVRVYWGGSGP
ncbi:MAG: hypothetical protein HY553_19425 [Elusimicrobia bacterium]|nr:hypothetical protein [Elusimicrobiota bacterium]